MKKPGTHVAELGGIYREVGPRGGAYDNYVTIPDHTRLPPTTKPNRGWKRVKKTPLSKR